MYIFINFCKSEAYAIVSPLNLQILKHEVRLIETCPNIRLHSFDDRRSTFQSRGQIYRTALFDKNNRKKK